MKQINANWTVFIIFVLALIYLYFLGFSLTPANIIFGLTLVMIAIGVWQNYQRSSADNTKIKSLEMLLRSLQILLEMKQ